ncbi:MAG TPA: ABC transporter ATP-binding protein [Microlunatus sp.]
MAGRTGSGKSTLVKVLAGLYAPHVGRVTVGGYDLGTLSPQERAGLVALVPQQVVLGPETIADDLRLAAPTASDAELTAATASVGLGAWLTGLPGGLTTPAGGASPLSAGERQLLALIRVALTRTPILILDEATADIDPATAGLVEVAVDALATDRTVIVVAHSAATLARLPKVFEVRSSGLVPVPPIHRASA